jgi:hypothetical protein
MQKTSHEVFIYKLKLIVMPLLGKKYKQVYIRAVAGFKIVEWPAKVYWLSHNLRIPAP